MVTITSIATPPGARAYGDTSNLDAKVSPRPMP